jgi:hypothetical protein
MGDYRYQPLPPVPGTERTPPLTRILWLAPGSGDDPLAGRLELINVEAAPHPYEALSYTWGTDPPSNYLWLQGCALPIRPNLETALRFLRLPRQARLLWVDAVCINQGDVDERTRQVQYMRLVYKNAACALVWVGVKTPGVEDAFDMARRLREIKERQKSSQAPLDKDTLVRLRDNYLHDMAPGSLARLNELYHRPYFKRVWCVQEVVAAPAALLKCEELEIPLTHVLEHMVLVRQMDSGVEENSPLVLWYRIWDSKQPSPSLSRGRVEGSLGSMLVLLDSMRSFQATDVRDKIFALQGICDEGLHPILSLSEVTGRREGMRIRAIRRLFTCLRNSLNSFGPNLDIGRPEALKVNYRKSALDVYIDVTRFMIRKSPRRLDVLDYVSHTSDPEGGSEYPSWVPKWFEPRPSQPMTEVLSTGFCDGHFRYFAEVHDNPLMGGARLPRTLSIDGFFVDSARGVSDVMRYETRQPEDTVATMDRSWSQIFPFPMTPPPKSTHYRDGQPLDLAFCKAVSAYPLGNAASWMVENWDKGADVTAFPSDSESRLSAACEDDGARAKAFLQQLNTIRAGGMNTPPLDHQLATSWAAFLSGVRLYSRNRRVFVTREGRLGLGPMMMQPGDEIIALFGGRFPFVVRRRQNHHVLIGQCYLVDDKVMYGKVTEEVLIYHHGPPRVTYHLR